MRVKCGLGRRVVDFGMWGCHLLAAVTTTGNLFGRKNLELSSIDPPRPPSPALQETTRRTEGVSPSGLQARLRECGEKAEQSSLSPQSARSVRGVLTRKRRGEDWVATACRADQDAAALLDQGWQQRQQSKFCFLLVWQRRE